MNALTNAATSGTLRGAGTRPRSTPRLRAIGASVWCWLEEVGRRRAAAELRLLADRWQPFNPALADELRAAAAPRSKP